MLLTEYVAHYADDYGLPQLTFTGAALRRINLYTWPGNIRELENCLRYLTCLQLGRPVNPDDLPLLLDREQEPPKQIEVTTEQPFHEAKCSLVASFERKYLENVLRDSGGNIAQAARASGKHRRAFFELMRKHGIAAADFCAQPVYLEEHVQDGAH